MSDKDCKDNFKRQTTDLYEAVGRFVVNFEHVCQALRSGIVFIFHQNGLENQNLINIVLADLTAYPLKSIYASLISEIRSLSDDERQIVNKIMKQFQNLIDARNNVIHSTWFIGYGNESTTDWSEALGMKPHYRKTGFTPKNFNYKADDFLNHANKAQTIASLIYRLNGCIIGHFSILDNFAVETDGTVRETLN